MKGLIPVTSLQENQGLFWASQDQNYLPRLQNYLKIEFSEYEWEVVAGYELTEELVKTFDAVAVTPISKRYCPQIVEWQPAIRQVQADTELFLRQMALKGAVLGRTTGYILAEGPKMSQKGQPQTQAGFSYDNVRQVMREHPNIYWEVLSFEDLKVHLRQNSKNVTVGLTPEAYAYDKYLVKEFPDVAVMKLLPKAYEKIPLIYEVIMLLTGISTILLMILRVFF